MRLLGISRWLMSVVFSAVLILGSSVPSLLSNRRGADAIAAARGGCQLLVGGVFSGLGAYSGLLLLFPQLPDPARVALSACFASAVILIDHALIETINQFRAEAELRSQSFTFRSPNGSWAGLRMALKLSLRGVQAISTAFLIATFVLVSSGLKKDINKQLERDTAAANLPLQNAVRDVVDAGIESRRVDAGRKQAALDALPAGSGPGSLGPPGVDATAGPRAAQIQKDLDVQRDLLRAAQADAGVAQARMRCESEGGTARDDTACQDATGIKGERKAFNLAKDRLRDAIARRDTAKTEIERLLSLLQDVETRTAAAREAVSTREDAAAHDRATARAAAQTAADDARKEYQKALEDREDAIARQMKKGVTYQEVPTGIYAQVKALKELDNGTGFIVLLELLLCTLELNALATATVLAARSAFQVKSLRVMQSEIEEELWQWERERLVRPPLDAFDRSNEPA